MKRIFVYFLVSLVFAVGVFAQQTDKAVPNATLIRILRAEDSRMFAPTIAGLLNSDDPNVRARAALAAGRIGDIDAASALSVLLEKDKSPEVRAWAAFALGELESMAGAAAVLQVLSDPALPSEVRSKTVEAAGKIGAANARHQQTPELAESILATLDAELRAGEKQDREVILAALTAASRAPHGDAQFIVARFLTNSDARVRADAAMTLSRVRPKNINQAFRTMLRTDTDAMARANAARALGAVEDKGAHELLIKAAIGDVDARARVSAIRALAGLRDPRSAATLIERGQTLIDLHTKSKLKNPVEKTELLEIATAVERLLPNSENEKAVTFLNKLRAAVGFNAGEAEMALARVAPGTYLDAPPPDDLRYRDPWVASAYAQGLGAISPTKNTDLKMQAATKLTAFVQSMGTSVKRAHMAKMTQAMPDLMRAMAAFQPDNLDEMLRGLLTNEDVFIRTTAAELIAERPSSEDNVKALKTAFSMSMIRDKIYDDVQLAILDALAKLDKRAAVGTLLMALNAPDNLVRNKAITILDDVELKKDFPGIQISLDSTRDRGGDHVLPYSPIARTRLGQVVYTDVDYRRALARRNGAVKAIFSTEKGTFSIDLFPEDAPLTVDNFINLARVRYFNGVEVHRVVANFVMQDGDPLGNGSGGPGWSIRCEINDRPYIRGAVGMALSGKDTGGSQWFVTHAPQPQLDGGYTVFGQVNEEGMKIVDSIVRGDKIISVRIVEAGSPKRTQRKR